MRAVIPVIDLFAGPGGLGEGFSQFRPPGRLQTTFRIAVSVEKDIWAHRTLELRSFYRQFVRRDVPDEYYRYLRREISREELFDAWPRVARAARKEARLAELGTADDERIYSWIDQAIRASKAPNWVLIGGPPCQAYSLIGRARRRADPTFEQDEKHFLYREYLEIINRFRPCVFVMENVKGLLSSSVNGEKTFQRILADLKQPSIAVREDVAQRTDARAAEEAPPEEYRIYSLVVRKENCDRLRPSDFVIRSETYGIPQTRHRVILCGVRSDIDSTPGTLDPFGAQIPTCSVLEGLPAIRSCLSKHSKNNGSKDSQENWRAVIAGVLERDWLRELEADGGLFGGQLREAIVQAVGELRCGLTAGSEFTPGVSPSLYRKDWYNDARLGGVCNHAARAHMGEDLHRYLFAACYAQVYGTSPMMRDFPTALLPEHKNIQEARVTGEEEDFDDRFRVQVAGKPATTITSHIHKDGHYNIHFDPTQCRSLTVREAARLQTFPDDYFFEGPRTQQYLQVGNAVPPLLAYQIAGVVYKLFEHLHESRRCRPQEFPECAAAMVARERARLSMAP